MKKFLAVLLALVLLFAREVSAFSDTDTHWAKEHIDWANSEKIVSGYPDNTFKPQGFITNAEFYKMVNKLKGYSDAKDVSFKDVKTDAWYYETVKIAMGAGYISDGENLNPNEKINRDEVARIIAKVYDISGDIKTLEKFKDKDEISNKEAVSALVEKEIISGDDKGNYRPDDPITRAEATKILHLSELKLEKQNLLEGINKGDLVILHTNDVHGEASASKKSIGYANYKNIIDEIKSKQTRVLVIDAGDASQGSNFASISKGRDVIDVLNAIVLQAFTPGNHEFDYSKESAMENYKNSKFKWYASNVFDEATKKEVFSKGEVMDLGGLKVGIFGLATPETKYKANPKNTDGISFAQGIEENAKIAKEEVERLRKEGANIVIMISHLGDDKASEVKSTDIAERVKGIDVIIDGHSHSLYENGLKRGNSFIASTGSKLENIGLTSVSPTGEVKSRMITKDMATPYGEDEKIKSKIEKVLAEQEKTLGIVIGKTATDLDGEREHVRTGETNLGNLITDAMKSASGADVVITNGGGIRASVKKGDITAGDIFTVLPFGNAMTVIEVSGKDIVDALNHGVKDYPNPAGQFPHVAGLSFEITEGTPSTVKNVMVGDKPIESDKIYTLATNDFMAVGGDDYTMFKGKPQKALYGSLANIVIDYIKELSKDKEFEYKKDGRINLSYGEYLDKAA